MKKNLIRDAKNINEEMNNQHSYNIEFDYTKLAEEKLHIQETRDQ